MSHPECVGLASLSGSSSLSLLEPPHKKQAKEFDPEPSFQAIACKLQDALGERGPGVGALRGFLDTLGIKAKREPGPKGAWFFSLGGSATTHRGTGKAAEAVLPLIKQRLKQQQQQLSIALQAPQLLPPFQPYIHAPVSFAPPPPLTPILPPPTAAMLGGPLPIGGTMSSTIPADTGGTAHAAVTVAAPSPAPQQPKEEIPVLPIFPGPMPTSKNPCDEQWQQLCTAAKTQLQRDLDEQNEMISVVSVARLTTKRKREIAEAAVADANMASEFEATQQRRLDMLQRRIRVQRDALAIAEEEDADNAAKTLAFRMQGPQKPQASPVGGGEHNGQASTGGEGGGDEDAAAHAASTLAYSMQGNRE